jgi:hypothetical protein
MPRFPAVKEGPWSGYEIAVRELKQAVGIPYPTRKQEEGKRIAAECLLKAQAVVMKGLYGMTQLLVNFCLVNGLVM